MKKIFPKTIDKRKKICYNVAALTVESKPSFHPQPPYANFLLAKVTLTQIHDFSRNSFQNPINLSMCGDPCSFLLKLAYAPIFKENLSIYPSLKTP